MLLKNEVVFSLLKIRIDCFLSKYILFIIIELIICVKYKKMPKVKLFHIKPPTIPTTKLMLALEERKTELVISSEFKEAGESV